MKKNKLKIISLLLILITLFVLKTYINHSYIKKQTETDNFIFYSSNYDKKCIDDLSNNLEENYNRILSDLNQKELNVKCSITIFPNSNTFYKDIGVNKENSWIVGIADKQNIKIVSPLNPGKTNNYEKVKTSLIHEFVHTVIYSVNNTIDTIPNWLNEGLAIYESNQFTDKNRQDLSVAINNLITERGYPSLYELESTDNFQSIGGYIYSYTLVEYIIDSYGKDKLIEMIENPDRIFNYILPQSKSNFEKDWKIFLNHRYS